MIASLPQRNQALEIGTGTGVLLERLLDLGFAQVIGIEPSKTAIDAAEPRIRPLIREGVFAEADFAPESFDLICCFQTLEHVPAPRALTESCLRLLRPGGALAFVTHDYTALINRVLGRRSPIIDIEHLHLFCRPSLDRLLMASGFSVGQIIGLSNRYPLRYWLRLSPLPGPLKRMTSRVVEALGLGGVRIGINLGNLLAVGHKPAARPDEPP